MTVAELIARLQKAPQDAVVESEGCDCYGDVHRVILDKDGHVMLARSDGAWSNGPRGDTEIV